MAPSPASAEVSHEGLLLRETDKQGTKQRCACLRKEPKYKQATSRATYKHGDASFKLKGKENKERRSDTYLSLIFKKILSIICYKQNLISGASDRSGSKYYGNGKVVYKRCPQVHLHFLLFCSMGHSLPPHGRLFFSSLNYTIFLGYYWSSSAGLKCSFKCPVVLPDGSGN